MIFASLFKSAWILIVSICINIVKQTTTKRAFFLKKITWTTVLLRWTKSVKLKFIEVILISLKFNSCFVVKFSYFKLFIILKKVCSISEQKLNKFKMQIFMIELSIRLIIILNFAFYLISYVIFCVFFCFIIKFFFFFLNFWSLTTLNSRMRRTISLIKISSLIKIKFKILSTSIIVEI